MLERPPFDVERVARNYSQDLRGERTNSQLRFEMYRLAEPPEDTEQQIVATLALQGAETVADIGTASGEFLFDLRTGKHGPRHYGALYGFEPYTRQLPSGWRASLAKRMDIVFSHGSASEIPLPDASADVLTALFMFYHVPPERQPHAINEFKRVLKPEGKFVLATSGRETIEGMRIENKMRLRDLESVMAGKLGVAPPPYMNEGYDTDKAVKDLPKHFAHVIHHKQRSFLVARTVSNIGSIRRSFQSLYDQFEPPLEPESPAVIKAENEVFDTVHEEFIRHGVWLDWIMRDFFICSDHPLTLPDSQKFSDISINHQVGSTATQSVICKP